jgi:dTDP-4-dehydrorhamnose reductase
MMKLVVEREELKVVDDQVGAPTWSRSLAEATAQAIAQCLGPARKGSNSTAELFAGVRGIYNMTSAGNTSWCGFTNAIVEQLRSSGESQVARVLPITSAEYPVRATRPRNSILDNSKLQRTFGLQLPVWDTALELVMDELHSIPPHSEVTTAPLRGKN